MPRIEYIPKVFNKQHRTIIDLANHIISQHSAQGFDLSLRQLYYQMVAHYNLPNTERSYKLIGNVLSDARLAGEIDWDDLKDRGRSTLAVNTWDKPSTLLREAIQRFKLDMWDNQQFHIEVNGGEAGA